MAYKIANRNQTTFLPSSIEEYIVENDPVRFYDAFINAIDLSKLGIEYNENKIGTSSYDPKSMLKLLVYGYSYGHKSSRSLERALHHNLSFIWLLQGLKPDHKTIAEFRRKNKKALQKLLRQTVHMCIKFNLIDGNILFVDGSKFRANASLSANKNKKVFEKELAKIETKIEKLLSECEKVDQEEKGKKSFVEVDKELYDLKSRQKKIKNLVKELDHLGQTECNKTDPDAKVMHSVEGLHINYNMQNVVDEKHGLIVNTDVVNDKNDSQQLSKQINQANEVLGKKCQTVCADSGYANISEFEKLDGQDIEVIVPSKRQARKEEKPFAKENFKYDEKKDEYICPAGKVLKLLQICKKTKDKEYRVKDPNTCKTCKNYGNCTKSSLGRKIYRMGKIEKQKKFESLYQLNQDIYKLRKAKVELPFGAIKHNFQTRSFLLRGLEGVKAESSLLCSCYNLKRMINLIGLDALINAMEVAIAPFFFIIYQKFSKYCLNLKLSHNLTY